MTTTTTDAKKRVITLTDRPPVRVDDESWPLIASAHDFEGEHDFQSNRHWNLKVRQHEDGRTLVYGTFDSNYMHEPDLAAGYLLVNDKNIVETIRQVGDEINMDRRAANRCVAALPATDI